MPDLQIQPVESEAAWEEARRIRQHVFVEEQGCPPEEEWDAHDPASRHLVGYAEGRAVAVARWRAAAHGEEIVAKLERFAVLPDCRGRGYGRAMVARAMRDARQAGFDVLFLHAQAHLENFYASFGFERAGAPFVEAGIPHVPMLRRG